MSILWGDPIWDREILQSKINFYLKISRIYFKFLLEKKFEPYLLNLNKVFKFFYLFFRSITNNNLLVLFQNLMLSTIHTLFMLCLNHSDKWFYFLLILFLACSRKDKTIKIFFRVKQKLAVQFLNLDFLQKVYELPSKGG